MSSVVCLFVREGATAKNCSFHKLFTIGFTFWTSAKWHERPDKECLCQPSFYILIFVNCVINDDDIATPVPQFPLFTWFLFYRSPNVFLLLLRNLKLMINGQRKQERELQMIGVSGSHEVTEYFAQNFCARIELSTEMTVARYCWTHLFCLWSLRVEFLWD